MAMTWIWTGMVVLSLVFGLFTGNLDAVADAAMDGAASAVELSVSMAGILCLWSGVHGNHECLRPLCRIGPGLPAHSAATDAPGPAGMKKRWRHSPPTCPPICWDWGNAATPLGIQAARRMARGCSGHRPSDELCLLVVLNTASIQLLPATIASVRSASGAQSPFDILPAVWLASALSVVVGVLTAKFLAAVGRCRR